MYNWKQQSFGPQGPKSPGSHVVRSSGGKLQFFKASEKVADSLIQAKANSQAVRIEKYFDTVFNGKDPDLKHAVLQRFVGNMQKTICFHCEDKGFHLVNMDAPNGQTYSFAYGCTCTSALKTDSIASLVADGLFDPSCQLGGPDGSLCPLVQKDTKCLEFNCPKFKGPQK